MAATGQPNKVQQQQPGVKGRDHPRFLRMNDDTTMMKQIQATHSPDGREIEVKPIVQVIEDILSRATPDIDGALHGNPAHLEALEDGGNTDALRGILEELAYTIHKISCELSCKCSGGGDAHATTMAIFNMLSHYSWDAKVVLTLAAFAADYGEFWLVIQLYATNPLAKSVALLKQVPDIIEHGNSLKSRFEALTKLIKVMLDVTKCIVEFKELPSPYISHDMPPMSTALAHIPTAAYWTIRGIVACASQIISLLGTGHEYISWTNESWELSTLAYKVSSIHEHLMQQLILCRQHIDEKKQLERYSTLHRIFERPHLDNQLILRTVIYTKDDIQPLQRGGIKANIEALRRKIVLLLISDLNIMHEEIMILEQFYREAQTKPEIEYEVVWLPVMDMSEPLNEEDQSKFYAMQKEMPWYTLVDPSLLDPAVVKYIKEVWRFTRKAILVVLDIQGKVVSQNALHMMWIWGNFAHPFSSSKEESLWKEETWRLDLLIDAIDAMILNWMAEGKYICIYGGENTDWILDFNKEAQHAAGVAGVHLEMAYVGKSNAKEKVRKAADFITANGLGYCWSDPTTIWFFWARLESMLYSKTYHGKTTANDPIFAQIQMMLSFDASDQGWAVICRGTEMAKAKGDMMLRCFKEIDQWKGSSDEIGFIPALLEYLNKLHTPDHCNRLILPGINGDIPEMVVCAECGRPMEKYFMYRCCTT